MVHTWFALQMGPGPQLHKEGREAGSLSHGDNDMTKNVKLASTGLTLPQILSMLAVQCQERNCCGKGRFQAPVLTAKMHCALQRLL